MADGQVALNGNSTTALARGNAADDAVTFALGTPGGATPAMTKATRFDVTGKAEAALVNNQSNAASVLASAVETAGMPLNAGSVRGSSIGITGNEAAATAYGNSATNDGPYRGSVSCRSP
ncbi:hypothetical protein [Sphingomonas dokdonensis]|uniref:Uncharacterized protein n=1 Tax=Sphingomonas dokdonensis TaxID=344880 RepID=A0A245ZNG0_9SPHN|nr:hypothetical protein [Sphingomonas dokdonensis]OWK31288.1 hypothetical protein SPDO_12950 [Sphingomonas dokdonensis]